MRFPRALAEQARLAGGAEIELHVEGRCIVLRPRDRRYDLDELVVQITPGNRHEEIDWGGPQAMRRGERGLRAGAG